MVFADAEALSVWKQLCRFSIAESLALTTLDWISSPLAIAGAIEGRRIQCAAMPSNPTEPCAIHVFGIGASNDRTQTMIGGLPYRPRERAWPERADGQPYQYVCQFNFTHWLPFCGRLPGDVLLVFSRDGNIVLNVEDQLYFEWYDIGLSDLPSVEDIPCDVMPSFCGHAQRVMSNDFRDMRLAEVHMERSLAECWERDNVLLSSARTWNAGRFSSTKIGGLPCWQDESGSRDWGNCEQVADDAFRKCLYLGQLSSSFPERQVLWPWLNRESPLPFDYCCAPHEYFCHYDGFKLHLFLDSWANVLWALDFP